jgi:hypothetical protein
MASRAASLRMMWRPPSSLPLLGLIAVGGAVAWTLLGCFIAVVSGSMATFWREWVLGQASFAVAAAIFLGFLALSPALDETIDQLTSDRREIDRWRRKPAVVYLRRFVVVFVMVVGTVTTTRLGFAVPPPTRYFMWATCAVICTLAGFATWHAARVLYAATKIEKLKIKFFVYSPGETKSLRKLAIHFVTYSLGMTFGYIFAFIGTMSPLWVGNPIWVGTVRAFWPTIYVPLCLVVTTYPHLAIHRLIRHEKDRLIVSYQEQINTIIGEGQSLSHQDVERINALADLIRRIENSPSFAVNFPIAAGTLFTYAINVGSLFIPKDLVAQAIRHALSP